MAGLIPHLIAGGVLYLVGRYYYQEYFQGEHARWRKLMLAFLCVFLSVIPDVFIGTYYTTHILSFDRLMPYQRFAHYVLLPIGIIGFALLAFLLDTKRKPLWTMAFCALLLHLLMDLLLDEAGLFI
jgi:Na+/melibiose symporter-like transporter